MTLPERAVVLSYQSDLRPKSTRVSIGIEELVAVEVADGGQVLNVLLEVSAYSSLNCLQTRPYPLVVKLLKDTGWFSAIITSWYMTLSSFTRYSQINSRASLGIPPRETGGKICSMIESLA